jgi:DeoR/GlpR family transcriptional regulator of sugar metabolism
VPARRNRNISAFERGFVLGRMYEQRRSITTARLRSLFDLSPATAKRDVRAMRRQGARLPQKLAIVAPLSPPLKKAA